MESTIFHIKGISPLIMHGQTGLDRFDPLTRQIAAINSKRKKTDDDHLELRKLEWLSCLYHDEGDPDSGIEALGPFIPGVNLKSMLIDAGKLDRLGVQVKRGIQIPELKIKLDYKGPRDPDALYGDGSTRFVDVRSVAVQRNRVMRTRPIFPEWGASFLITYDPALWDRDVLSTTVAKAGQYIGLCDYRPEFGRFKVVETD